MATATKPAAEEAAAPAKGSNKLLLIIIVLLVLLLAGGGVGGYFYMNQNAEPAPPEPGKVFPLESITVNLAAGHFLKIRIALQSTAEVAEALDGSKAQDLVIQQFSNMPVAELSSAKAREHAKAELKEKIEKAYEEEVMDIYFTEFVMQ